MIGQLLRLKVRLLVNGLRSPRTAVAAGVGIIFASAGVMGLWMAATALGTLDALTVHRIVVVAGSYLSFGAFLLPLMIARSELLDPRALRGYGFRRLSVGAVVLLASLIGPAIVLLPIALAPLALWSGDGAVLAAVSVPLIVLQGVLAARLGVVLGSGLRRHPVWSGLVGLAGIFVIAFGILVIAAHLAPSIATLAPGSMWGVGLGIVLALGPFRDPRISEFLEATPVGSLWRPPLYAEVGEPAAAAAAIGAGVLVILGLLLLWALAVAFALRATHRIPRARAARVPGWFRRLPSTPFGAIAARSLSYWVRDPRYRAVAATLPVVAALMVLVMSVAGVPVAISSLVPLPIVLLILSWSTLHNDVAYDSTAVWSHLAAQTRGPADRFGRMLPVLMLGLVLLVVGAPLTTWVHGDSELGPAIFGVGAAVLFGGAGISSLISARFPYPAPRPGDRSFQQPQVPGRSGGAVQVGSVLLILLVTAPALVASGLWFAGVPGPWNWVALAVGTGVGLAVLVIGVRGGGVIFERRAPELLAFTMQN